jgi:hypothetical protein
MTREWRVTGEEESVTGFALGALESLAAGAVKGASVEMELWANRQLDTMVDLGWIEAQAVTKAGL